MFQKRETGSTFSLRKTQERCVCHMLSLSLRNTLAFQVDYDSDSIYLKCCIRTCEHFILTKKENYQIDNYGKFGKKLLL